MSLHLVTESLLPPFPMAPQVMVLHTAPPPVSPVLAMLDRAQQQLSKLGDAVDQYQADSIELPAAVHWMHDRDHADAWAVCRSEVCVIAGRLGG